MPESSQQLFRFKPGCPLVVFHTPGDLSRRFFLFLEPPLLVLLQFWINIGVFNAILWGLDVGTCPAREAEALPCDLSCCYHLLSIPWRLAA